VAELNREAPTLEELRAHVLQAVKADELTAEQAKLVLQRATPAPLAPPQESAEATPAPVYTAWTDYLARTSEGQRRAWCVRKAGRANRPRLMSGTPTELLTGEDVWAVLESARGRCVHCSSLAVENRPSKPNGAPAAWSQVGRRIGSLGHMISRFHGGPNTPSNLAWSCLWCNTWQIERRQGATDHGGLFPLTD
jgi:hypothetical protein